MRSIDEFIAHLRSLDVKVWADGNTLRYNAPEETLTPALLSQMREWKAEILTFLQKENFHLPPILPVKRDKNLPLSFAQQRLWFLAQLKPGKSIYNLTAAYRITGSLNVTALEQSFDELVQCHEILRTTFPSVNGQPVQRISPKGALTLPLINLEEVAPNQREAEAKRQAMGEAQRPFDLTNGPLFRVKLLRLTEQEYVVLLNTHHIIFDAWSFDEFFRELTALYEAFAYNQPSPLRELPIQYADFAVWQRHWFQGDVLQSQMDYWSQQLGGDLPLLELPTDYPRPLVKTYQGASQSLELAKDLTEALTALSQREGVTLFMTLLAAFQTLLYRYSGQSDIIVGTPIAGRNQVETEGLIGCFINILVLRTDLDGSPSFRSLLGRVREVALGAYAHQDLPFEKLLEELRPERDQSRTPLFQVLTIR